MKRGEMTTFAKVNTIFVCIFLLFLIVGVMALNISAGREIADVGEMVRTRMTYFMSGFKAEIGRVNTAVRSLYLNQDVNTVSANPGVYMDYELASALIRIEEQKTALESVSANVKGAKIFIPSVGLVFRDSYGSVGNFYKQSAQAMREYARDIQYGKIFIEDGEIVIGYPFTTVNKEMTLMALVYLDADKLAADLGQALVAWESRYDFSLCGGEFSLSCVPPEARNDARTYMTSEIYDEDLDVRYTVYVPRAEVLSEYRTILFFALALTAMFLIGSAAFYFVTKRLVHRPMLRLMEGFKQMETGAFPVRIGETGGRDFGYIYSAFNEMNVKLDELIDLTYNQKILLQTSELKQLQAQINPHFLYNTLFLMHSLIQADDTEKAMLLSRELGQYYQYITRNAAMNVTLREENRHARIYSDIQAARFDGRISAEYEELPEHMANLTVPRLILQPLIENAYAYGLAEMTEGGRLRVTFHTLEKGYAIRIEDNGGDLTDARLDAMRAAMGAREGEVTGSINIDRRIRILFAEGSGLFFSRSDMGGLRAEIRLIPKTPAKGG